MSVGINDFWKLAVKSGAVTSEQAHALHRKYAGENESANGDANQLAEWLVQGNVLSRYQARVLLKGLAGPFRFGDYRIADRFSDSQFKQSFCAVHAPSGHQVVLRFYDAKLYTDAARWQELANTVAAFAQLRSPRLQPYFEWVEEGSYRFAVLQYIEGARLGDLCAAGERLDWEAVLRTVRQVAEALAEVSSLGRAHRDVRPESIWRSPYGCIYLCLEPVEWNSPQTLVASTDLDRKRLDYLAPELTVAGQMPSMLTDLYALGCTAYELLTGHAPFADLDGPAKIEAHVRQTPAPLSGEICPEPVQKLIHRLMAKNPQVRFQSPQELIDAVNALLPTSDPLPIPQATQSAYEASLNQKQAPPPASDAAVPSAAVPPASSAEHAGATESPPVVVTEAVSGEPLPSQTAAPIVVSDGSSTPRRRRRKRKRPYALYVWLALGVLGASFAAYHFYPKLMQSPAAARKTDRADSGDRTKADPIVSPVATTDQKSPAEAASGPVLVHDDGQTLWADVVQGEPISLAYVPPGAQLLIHARPAELLAVEPETKFIAALGPRLDHYWKSFESQFRLPWKDIEQVVVAFGGAEMSFPRPSMVVYLAEAVDIADLVQRWGNPAEEVIAGKKTYPIGEWRAYVPQKGAGRIIVLASPDDLADILEFDGAPPALLRQVTTLVQHSNDRHHVTVVAVPSYLSNNLLRDDFDFYFGDPGKVRDALSALLIDEVNALSLTMVLADPVYLECRMSIGSAPDPKALLTKQRERIRSLADWAEDRLSSTQVPEYWRRVALRFPQMLRFVDEYVRGTAEDRQLIFNAVLPPVAPQNLLVGLEMMLMSGESTTTSMPPKPTKKTPTNIDELLATKISMMFDQQPLDFALNDLQAIVKDQFPDLGFPFSIKILGNDLLTAGITQNQQIVNFNEQDKTLAEILTSIVMKANPITTVKKPSEEDQQLVWVIGPDPDDPNQQVILITTRDAAKTKQYTLPKPFVPETD